MTAAASPRQQPGGRLGSHRRHRHRRARRHRCVRRTERTMERTREAAVRQLDRLESTRTLDRRSFNELRRSSFRASFGGVGGGELRGSPSASDACCLYFTCLPSG